MIDSLGFERDGYCVIKNIITEESLEEFERDLELFCALQGKESGGGA